MTLDQILVFHKIVQYGSFKSASLSSHKTQPALSVAMRKLEEELGVALFDRSEYRPNLTPFGKAFLEKTLPLLDQMKEIDQLKLSFLNKEEPELKMAIDGISPLPHLLKIFKNFSTQYPFTKLSLDFDILFEVEAKVLAQDFSMGITHFVSSQHLLEMIPLGKVKMAPVINSQMMIEKNVKSLDQLKMIDQIILGGKIEKQGQSFGLLEGGKKWRVTDYNFKREIILAGLGWGHLPIHTIEREVSEGKLVVLDFENVFMKELDIFLIKSKKTPLGPVGSELWKELTTLHKK
jgi:DNA-binding transcriptional LysR family regulator